MNISPIGYASTGMLAPTGTATEPSVAGSTATANAAISGSAKTSSQEPEKEPSLRELQDALQNMNDFVGALNNNSLRFSIDTDTGQTVVKVMDGQTNEVLKQIPSKEMLAISKALDKLKGLLVQQKA